MGERIREGGLDHVESWEGRKVTRVWCKAEDECKAKRTKERMSQRKTRHE